jgi:G3E family GTPase
VRHHGLAVRELFGGCICCTLQTGLAQMLREIEAEFDPDWAVVEPTGLAAPGDISRTVLEFLPSIHSATVLTIVDAERWEMLIEVVEPLVTAQIEAADVIAINKVDAAGETAATAVTAAVHGLNAHAPILLTSAAVGRGLRELSEAVLA